MKGGDKMNRAKTQRRFRRNRGYKSYHKKNRYGRNNNNKGFKKKLLYIFLSLLLIYFPYKSIIIQIWRDDEEIQIIDVPTIIDDEEIEEVKEVCGSECDNEQETSNDVRVDTKSPRFVMDGRWNVGYTRTWYDVDVEGGILSSYGKYWNDKDMRVEGNFIQYNDEQYGWINVYALNVDQMKEYGTVVTSTVLGSIIEVKLPNSTSTHYGIVLDVCGACAKAKKIDVWVKNQYVAINNGTHIDNEVEFRFKRFGFDGEPIVYKEK
jgi:hypothetical protein